MNFSHLAVAPLYIIVSLMGLGYLIFCWKDKGCLNMMFKIYVILHISIYFIALYFYITGKWCSIMFNGIRKINFSYSTN